MMVATPKQTKATSSKQPLSCKHCGKFVIHTDGICDVYNVPSVNLANSGIRDTQNMSVVFQNIDFGMDNDNSEYLFVNDMVEKYSEADLSEIRDYYRRNTELTWILTGLWYILNIIDANVDAHFFDYDISDDLTIQIQPVIESGYMPDRPIGNTLMTGVGISVKF